MTTALCDDPRLTAYALGELSGDDQITLERQLAGDPEARAEVERLRALTRQLDEAMAHELAATPALALTAAQHAAIRQAAAPRRLTWGLVASGLGTAVAAGLLVMVAQVVGGRGQQSVPTPQLTQKISDARAALPITVLEQPQVAPPLHIEIDEEVATLPSLARLDGALEEKTQAQEDKEAFKGREEAVANTERGSTGAFTAIGAGGSVGLSGNRSGNPSERKSSATTPGGSAGMFGSRSGDGQAAADRAAPAAPSAPAGEQELLADAKLRYGAATHRRFEAPVAASGTQTPAPASPASATNKKTGTRPLPSSPGFSTADEPPALPVTTAPGSETYTRRADNPFQASYQTPLSTFSLDVDTASYSNVRRFLDAGRLPPRDAVRCEEMINYFPYKYPAPTDGTPFAIHAEIAPCPWNPRHRLAKIALKGKELATGERPACNLVFLIDVSGSMQPENRLPLIKTGLSMLVEKLSDRDRVAIVTYAGQSGVALPATSGSDKREILRAINRLSAEGGTNGGAGITLAYQVARQGFAQNGVNRVILCTDGDFNVGVTNRDELTAMVQRESGGRIFLSVMGVGHDSLQDATMEQLADRGNGHYAYLDTVAEAHKVLIEQMSGTLVPIAKDVKVQVEFNPARIAGYRLIGYEKRMLAAREFNDDSVDAGEVGAGHAVTALYEIVPAGADAEADGLRYQPQPAAEVEAAVAGEWLTVKLRYKLPEGGSSRLITGPVTDAMVRTTLSPDLRLAAAAATFAQVLRGNASPGMTWANLREQVALAVREGGGDYAREFAQLVERAARLAGNGGER